MTQRRMLMVLLLTAIAAMACRTLAPDAAPVHPPMSDLDLGLRKTALSDDRVPPSFVFPEDGPGGNDRLPLPYEGAPPLIPHSLEEFLPITSSENACVLCHQTGSTDPEDPPQVPASHLTDLRRAPDVVRETVAGARWNCTACHVTQSNAPALVENRFGSAGR